MSSAPAEPGPSLDRNPPQDIDAEKSVLGAMLSSKDAIADVVEEIKGVDFYRPGHELIFNTITDLYGRGDPADTVTTADELDRRGELERAGGRLYLAELLTNVTVTANAAYYAKIVAEKAVLRRLVEASIRIAQMGYQGQGEVADIVDAAQQTLYDVSTRKTSEEYHPLSELFESTFDELEAIEARGDAMAGIPTGFTDLDELTKRVHARPDDHRRRPSGHGKIHSSPRLCPRRRHQEPSRSCNLQPRDGAQRDRHEIAICRGRDRAVPDACGAPVRRGLAAHGRQNNTDLVSTVVHR